METSKSRLGGTILQFLSRFAKKTLNAVLCYKTYPLHFTCRYRSKRSNTYNAVMVQNEATG